MDGLASILVLGVGVGIGWLMGRSDAPDVDKVRSEAMEEMCRVMLSERNIAGYQMADEYTAVLKKVLGG